MANLKTLRVRRGIIQSTRKITAAMKFIAASKLRKAQTRLDSAKPYAAQMNEMLQDLATKTKTFTMVPRLLLGTGSQQKNLLILMTSDRGLCGSFNTQANRRALKLAQELKRQKKDITVICIGRKGYEFFKTTEFKDNILASWHAYDTPTFLNAKKITKYLLEKFNNHDIDVCTLVYNHFESVISQFPAEQQLIPFLLPKASPKKEASLSGSYSYEPSEEKIFNKLLPKNLEVQVFKALLENAASEHGARMTCMEGATRNADDMINHITLQYNRTRQAYITNELTEIISGAEAL